jgi:transcriptional regulator with XRE-family HTH domain
MKDELRNWDPFPLKQKVDEGWVFWDDDYLRKRERFKDNIRPPAIPETARGLGVKLRTAREARGVTIEQAADATHIMAQQIEAIECGDLDHLPGGLYTRRFIELYARFLSFDLKAVSKALIPASVTAELLKDSFTSALNYKQGKSSAKSGTDAKLPRLGELLLYYFLPEEERDAFIGDMEEQYAAIEKKFGIRAAEIFFYKEILNSMSPLVARFLARIVHAILEEMTLGK